MINAAPVYDTCGHSGFHSQFGAFPSVAMPPPTVGIPYAPPQAAAERHIMAERYKTKMCRNYLATGACPYETRCMFAHGQHELRTPELNLRDGLITEEAIKAYQRVLNMRMRTVDDVSQCPPPELPGSPSLSNVPGMPPSYCIAATTATTPTSTNNNTAATTPRSLHDDGECGASTCHRYSHNPYLLNVAQSLTSFVEWDFDSAVSDSDSSSSPGSRSGTPKAARFSAVVVAP